MAAKPPMMLKIPKTMGKAMPEINALNNTITPRIAMRMPKMPWP